MSSLNDEVFDTDLLQNCVPFWFFPLGSLGLADSDSAEYFMIESVLRLLFGQFGSFFIFIGHCFLFFVEVAAGGCYSLTDLCLFHGVVFLFEREGVGDIAAVLVDAGLLKLGFPGGKNRVLVLGR